MHLDVELSCFPDGNQLSHITQIRDLQAVCSAFDGEREVTVGVGGCCTDVTVVLILFNHVCHNDGTIGFTPNTSRDTLLGIGKRVAEAQSKR